MSGNTGDSPTSLTAPPEGYADWLADLKGRIHTAQQRPTRCWTIALEGINLVLLTLLKDPQQRLAYALSAAKHGWSRNMLNIHIETRLLERSGTAVTNFEVSLPKPQSDLARESLKDRYRFDFLGLTDEAQEREIENAPVKHVTDFLLELGAGFAFVGRQVQA